MRKDRAAYCIAVGGFLALLTAGLLYLVAQNRMTPEVNQVLVIIAGMTTVAALTAFQQSVENSASPSFVNVSFNEVLVSQSLADGYTIPDPSRVDEAKVTEPWELSLVQLVGSDNSLALAKLRMELERELRHIAYNNQTDISSRPLGVTRIAQELVSRNILPPTWLGALKEITYVCNQAVHGTEIPDDITASVVRVGGQLLEQLRSVRNNGGTS
ncbi:MAG: hypothetical protein OXP71_11740 [Candidatus Poribacteria bacterium]|nr:hypothetical protein [Candidatus Poribacteria bacterium]